jgi:penicillin-insensitive murein endopeptidase
VLVAALLAASLWARGAEAREAQAFPVMPVPSESIGGAAAGCVAGARQLPLVGDNYQVIRPARGRYWGHPDTVAFVQDLASRAKAAGIGGLLVGDMGLAHGGPMPSGHASHQNGTDVDIWLRLADGPLAGPDLDSPKAVVMVKGAETDPAAWSPAQSRLIELAAQSPKVERIFVNPAIKLALCGAAAPNNRDWLSKIRPWWGHDAHFHVRLGCPAGSPDCEPQKPVPDGDGCGAELMSWLEKPTSPEPPERPHVQSRPLPQRCRAVMESR